MSLQDGFLFELGKNVQFPGLGVFLGFCGGWALAIQEAFGHGLRGQEGVGLAARHLELRGRSGQATKASMGLKERLIDHFLGKYYYCY